jgi:hypothetical protein
VGAKYLLPCPCGEQMPVETRQAGETIACACGSPLLVPAMREIMALEPAPERSSEPSAPVWTMYSRIGLLGWAIAGLAIFWVLVLNINHPVSRFSGIDPYQIAKSAQNMPPLYAWNVWQDMKKGLDRRTDEPYAAAVVRFHIWEAVAGGVALIGVALIAVGAILGKQQGGPALHPSAPG